MKFKEGQCWYIHWNQDPKKCRAGWDVNREEVFYVIHETDGGGNAVVRLLASTSKNEWEHWQSHAEYSELREIPLKELPLYINWPHVYPELLNLIKTGNINGGD